MQEKTIVKMVRAESPFEIILRETLQDKRLSLKSLGALCRLISQPGDWTWELWYLEENILKVGRDARKKIFAELETAGYLIHSKYQDQKGQWQHSYQLFAECRKEKLNTEVKPSNDKSSDGKAVDGEAADGKDVDIIHNTQLENTELENTQPQQQAAEAAAVSSGDDLIFPLFFCEEVVQKIEHFANALDQSFVQQVLDVLAARPDVKNPVAFFLKLASTPSSFDPTAGLKIAAARSIKKEVEVSVREAGKLSADPQASAKGKKILEDAAARRAARI